MSRAFALALVVLPTFALADRLITIPTARKLPYKTIRYELRFQPADFGRQENILDAGIGPAWEAEIQTRPDSTWEHPVTGDIEYNYVAAIPGVSPGVSFGVQDAANETRTGRRSYVVTTYRLPGDVINGEYSVDLTIGFFAAARSTPFVGVLYPFSKEFHLLAEDDGRAIAAGFEMLLFGRLNLRAQTRNARPLLSAQFTVKL